MAALFRFSVQHTGQIVLRDVTTGTENVLALTMDSGYDHHIIKGAYDIVYQHRQGENVPQNKNALIAEGQIIKGAVTIDVNVPSRLYGASVFHNGLLFPASAQQMGNILLRNPDSGDLLFFGKTSLQNLSALVVPGTYDVYYSHLNGVEVPQNQMARFQEDLVVAAPGPYIQMGEGPEFHVNSVQITGQMLMNDSPMPASEFDDGLLSIVWEEDSVLLGNTNYQTYQVRVLNDPDWNDFWIHYEVQSPGDTIPINEDARFKCMRLEPLLF